MARYGTVGTRILNTLMKSKFVTFDAGISRRCTGRLIPSVTFIHSPVELNYREDILNDE